MNLKVKVHSLRHQVRQIEALNAKVNGAGSPPMTRRLAEQYKWWKSGGMERELDDLTRQHGYGKLRAQTGHLGPIRFSEQVRS